MLNIDGKASTIYVVHAKTRKMLYKHNVRVLSVLLQDDKISRLTRADKFNILNVMLRQFANIILFTINLIL